MGENALSVQFSQGAIVTRLKRSHRMSLPCNFISFSSIHVGGRGEGRGVLGKGGSAELGGRNQGPSPLCVLSHRRGSASTSNLRPGTLVGSSPQGWASSQVLWLRGYFAYSSHWLCRVWWLVFSLELIIIINAGRYSLHLEGGPRKQENFTR